MTFDEWWGDGRFGWEKDSSIVKWFRMSFCAGVIAGLERSAIVCENERGCENDVDYSHVPEGHDTLARKIRALPVEEA